MGANAPDSVKRLVDHLDQNRRILLSCDYKGQQLHPQFLNPFFTTLGREMNNTLDMICARSYGSVPFPLPDRRHTGATLSLAEVFMKSRMTEMVTFGSVRGTYNPEEERNGFYSTV